MAYEPNFMDILTASTDEDARAKAQIMAEQLRGDKQLGMMGQLGGKRAAGMGKEMLADSDAGEKGLLTAGVNRLHYGTQAQDLKREKFSTDMMRALAVQQGKNEASSERGDVLRQIAELRASQAGAGQGDKQEKADTKDWYSFADKHNANIASSRNVLGMTAMKQAQAARLLTLADSQKALDPQEVTEFSLGMAGLLQAGGSSGAVAHRLVEEIRPRTFKGDAATFLQYITAHPKDAGAQEFVKRMVRTIKREQDVMEEQAHNTMLQGAASRRDLLRKPNIEPLARDYFNRAGLSHDQINMIYGDAPMPRAALPGRNVGAGGGSPDPMAEAKAWLAANPNDPRAASVAAKIKAGGQ